LFTPVGAPGRRQEDDLYVYIGAPWKCSMNPQAHWDVDASKLCPVFITNMYNGLQPHTYPVYSLCPCDFIDGLSDWGSHASVSTHKCQLL